MDTTTRAPAAASAALAPLDALVGRWRVEARAADGARSSGTTTFRWMEGGWFLVQEVELDEDGTAVRTVEYVGWDEEARELRSHAFDSTGGLVEHVWQLEDGRLEIWCGHVGSLAAFRGRVAADGSRIAGRWTWPGGGSSVELARLA